MLWRSRQCCSRPRAVVGLHSAMACVATAGSAVGSQPTVARIGTVAEYTVSARTLHWQARAACTGQRCTGKTHRNSYRNLWFAIIRSLRPLPTAPAVAIVPSVAAVGLGATAATALPVQCSGTPVGSITASPCRRYMLGKYSTTAEPHLLVQTVQYLQ